MADKLKAFVSEDQAEKMRLLLGKWLWINDAPYVLHKVENAPGGKFRVVVEPCECDEDSMAWKHGKKHVTFGKDRTILEKWMDRDYVIERTGQGQPFLDIEESDLSPA